MLGKWQLEGIRALCSVDLPAADLTLALMHHPLDWLSDKEQSQAFKFLGSPALLNADGVLHGHFHRGDIRVTADPDATVVSLVSGIGYPPESQRERGRVKPAECRYALYEFDTKRRRIGAWLRAASQDSHFAADTALYELGAEDGHVVMPMGGETAKSLPAPMPARDARDDDATPVLIEADPIPIVWEWVGREAELQAVLRDNARVVAITGIGGQGKTALAAEFLRRHTRGSNPRFDMGVWANCRELPDSLHVKTIKVLEAMTSGKEAAALYTDERPEDTGLRLLRQLRARRVLLVLDNIDAYVNARTEGPTPDLEPIVDAILNHDHGSLVLLTCRSPLNDPRASFSCVKLSGLSIEEGLDFFRRRGIPLQGDNGEQHCTELIRLTRGHPWWMGLVAGQILHDEESLRACVEKFGQGESAIRARIQQYYKSIWDALGKDIQKLLRYLVEAPRPLTFDEISEATRHAGPKKLERDTRRLERLGLVEPHEVPQTGGKAYQAHPLAREFVHESFSPSAQRSYVSSVLCIFLPGWLVELLFSGAESLQNRSAQVSPEAVAQSLETCLNSRHYAEALSLLGLYWTTLRDVGEHHVFRSLACRTLDAVDWSEVQLPHSFAQANLLNAVISQLNLMGDALRCARYLSRYEAITKPDTALALPLLNLKVNLCWEAGAFGEALPLLSEYDALAARLNFPAIAGFEMSRALVLRDTGRVDEALQVFRRYAEEGDAVTRAGSLGNSARCYLKLGRPEQALELLRESLALLTAEKGYESRANTGYAYLWIAEALLAMGRSESAKAFLTLAQDVWQEYSPVLLRELKDLQQTLAQVSEVALPQAKAAEAEFLEGRVRATSEVAVGGEPVSRSGVCCT
jgi:tetratricopeptide (TPR) repeat protein